MARAPGVLDISDQPQERGEQLPASSDKQQRPKIRSTGKCLFWGGVSDVLNAR